MSTEEDKVVFKINGKTQEVSTNINCFDSLNDYIRRELNLRGTKVMCREGGCGVCIVNVTETHPVTNEQVTYAVNSCLISPFSCNGKEITTIEGIGNKKQGYHKIQSRLANFNGSQCGFCSPGWVMNMYSALKSSQETLTMKEIENYFAGNLCRCTGYRPILDAMKSFATDASYELKTNLKEISDLEKFSVCENSGEICCRSRDDFEDGFCVIDMKKEIGAVAVEDEITIDFKDHKWIVISSLPKLLNLISKEKLGSYRLIAGNTGQGVYRRSNPKLSIDINGIEELRTNKLGTNLVLGGGMTLNEVMNLFKELAKKNTYYQYLKVLYDHLDLVAHYPVRNVGTLAGNLSLKHEHPDFPSDVFLLLETVGAVITICDETQKYTMNLPKFLQTDMTGKVIYSVELPPLSKNHYLQTYKIMPRAQNAHAIVNAGFLIKFKSESSPIVESATFVYGNINPSFIHATNTEKSLVGKTLYNNTTLQLIIDTLSKEINPNLAPPEPSPEYRKKLAIALAYKFFLSVSPQRLIEPTYRSGGSILNRPLSSGRQNFDTKSSEYPVNQPIIKIEAPYQCAGEAKYVDDMPTIHDELFASFILSTVHAGTLTGIDASNALKIKGVVGFYTASDIPGTNSFTSLTIPFTTALEEIMVEIGKKVKHHSQPIAIIVAENPHILQQAAALVKVTYKDVTSKPILNIHDVLNAPDKDSRINNDQTITATDRGSDIKKVLKGKFDVQSQYHFHMETQTCITIPVEDGLEVYSATQFIDHVQVAIASMLKMSESTITVNVRRLGAAYGGKVSRATQIACASALAAHILNRPVRMVLPFETNMKAIGKKHSTVADYEVGVNTQGEIQYLTNTFYQDNGCSSNETITQIFTIPAFLNCYNFSTWSISANSVITEIPSNTFLRSPGTCEGIAMIENIMDHIAAVNDLDPIKVRLANMATADNPLPEMMEQFTKSTDYYSRLREVDDFNSKNRWLKKGIKLNIIKFPFFYFPNFAVDISIYHSDGSVSVTHGGIEMGQGINTKVAQVVAKFLGVPIDSILIKPSNSHATPNSFVTGASMGSDLCCYAAMRTCQLLNERLDVVKKTLTNPSWLQLVTASYAVGIDLNASFKYNATDPIQAYPIHAICISEVEVDILTGNFNLNRVDIVEDVGDSLSPKVDVGQIEGAFIMGLGYWTVENLEYNRSTGELLTDRTWTYKIPGAKDIPIDFRVNFRRNATNPFGVLGSKTTGEPPLTLAFSVAGALRCAMTSARIEAGMDRKQWFDLKYPLTTENIFMQSGTETKHFKLQR